MTVLEKDDGRAGERMGLTEPIEVPWKHSSERAEAKPEQTDQWRKITSERRSAETIHAVNPGRSEPREKAETGPFPYQVTWDTGTPTGKGGGQCQAGFLLIVCNIY